MSDSPSSPKSTPRHWINRAIFLLAMVGLLVTGWKAWQRHEDSRRISELSKADASGATSFDVSEQRVSARVQAQLDRLDPESNGWTSEAITERIGKQLSKIGSLVEKADEPSIAALSDAVAPDFQGNLPSNNGWTQTYRSETLVAKTLSATAQNLLSTQSIKEQLRALGVGVAAQSRHKFKVFGIQLGRDTVSSRVLLEAVGNMDAGLQQWNSELICEWRGSEQSAGPLRLSRLRIAQLSILSQVGNSSRSPMFEDVTRSVFRNIDDPASHLSQLANDTGYWSQRLCKIDDADMFGHHGIAIGDVNLDGRPDLYVCDTGGLPNRLYLQAEDGTLQDFSRQSNANWLESTRSALLIDLDNDNDLDLMAATVAGIIIAENDGNGVFRVRNAIAGISEAYSMAAADFDNDRDIDVYVTIYGPGASAARARGFEAASPIPYDDANNGGANLLLANQGNFQFANATASAGLDTNNRRFSFAASWEDFDRDGDLDLYVANDFGRNNLYQNTDGRFDDVAAALGVEDRAGGMSVSWGDANLDGRPDIYVGNMFSAAGSRVTYQRKFLSTRSTGNSTSLQRMARGNTLFIGRADGGFADASEAAAVWMGRWAWGSKFADLNNDGWEDLIVANGYFTNRKQDDL